MAYRPWLAACIWLPDLPLRVEVLRHPALDGAPLVLGGGPGEKKVVQLCSLEAERAGIKPGLPLREVVPLCPDAVVLQPDPVRVATTLDDVARALQMVSPLVEATGENVYLDLRGLSALYRGSYELLDAAIREAVPELLRPCVGIGAGKFVAAVAATSSKLRVVPPQETVAFLAPLPIGHLPFSPDELNRLELLGLRTIGELGALPFSAVQAQFGPAGARAWRLAHGQDDEPILPRQHIVVVRAALRFEAPLATVDSVMAALNHLIAVAFSDPVMRTRSARQARLRALLSDDTTWERLYPFKEPLATPESIGRYLRGKLTLPDGMPPAPIDEMVIDLFGLGGATGQQVPMFGREPALVRQLAETARQLGTRYGRVPLYHLVEVEPWSRIPERRWALATAESSSVA